MASSGFLVGVELLKELDYAWMGSYNQRALLVKILYHSKLENKIEGVKFITRENDGPETADLVYNCETLLQILTLGGFYEFINSYFESFEHSEIAEENWKEILYCIEVLDLKCNIDVWSSEKSLKTDQDVKDAFENLSAEQREYVSAFVTAMTTDMKNGQMWMHELVKTLLTYLQSGESKLNVKGFVSGLNDATNSAVEANFDDEIQYDMLHFNLTSDASSNSSSSLNLESASECTGSRVDRSMPKFIKQTTTADYCVALPDFPGVFPLVVVLKPIYQESQAYTQITQQMLSKLFFQDIVFGLIVSPRSFQLCVIIKKGETLHFAGTHHIPLIKIKNKDRMLDLKQLNTMCTYIYRIIKWATKTKCMLTTLPSC